MIDRATVDKILSTAKIEEVVADFVTLRKRGVNLIGLCPFHDEKTPSFTVSPAKNICKCFGCAKGFGPVNFIMEHEHLEYVDALRYLARKYNITIEERELSREELAQQNDREAMFAINQFAQTRFVHNLWDTDEGKSIGLSYFKERGFRDDIIKKFGLGYSLNKYDSLSLDAAKNGFEQRFLYQTGLCSQSERGGSVDRFRGRVMFPVHTLAGKIVAFGGRVLVTSDNTSKYLNSPESEIYHKSNELYGIYFARQAISKADCCFLVEGYTDVISMHQSGIENVVASSGTSLTTGQIRAIHRFTNNITVLYDCDSAGIKASIRGIDMLLKEGMNIKVVLLPQGEDPDSYAQSHDSSEFYDYITRNQTDFIRFKTKLLLEEAGSDPIVRARLISDIVSSISVIPNAITRSVYVKECASSFGMNESILLKEVEKKFVKPEADTTLPAPVANTEIKPYTFVQEQNLLRYILRYGQQNITINVPDENGELVAYTLSVIEFIRRGMEDDNQSFEYPLHLQVFNEALQQTGPLDTYFINHPDRLVQQYVFPLIEDKYERSNIHGNYKSVADEQDRLDVLVPRALLEYKAKCLEREQKNLDKSIKAAQQQGDTVLLQQLLQQKMQYNALKQAIAKQLGR